MRISLSRQTAKCASNMPIPAEGSGAQQLVDGAGILAQPVRCNRRPSMSATAHLSLMSRRCFLQSAVAAGAGILSACAGLRTQGLPRKSALLGYLGSGEGPNTFFEDFRQALQELGYVEGE